MKKTTAKRVSKNQQKYLAYNPEIIYHSLLVKLFLNDCIDYYSNRWNSQYTEEDVFKCDECPPLFNEYILDNHKHVMYLDKQANGYNFYIQIDYYNEINEIDEEDGDTIVNYQQLEDKLQCFIYKSETDEFIQITENEYNNYIELNERIYSKIKNKNHVFCSYYTDYMIPRKNRIDNNSINK